MPPLTDERLIPSPYRVHVSIIIPVAGSAIYLDEQLEALSQQVGAPAFEVLVVDNGATVSLEQLIKSQRAHLDVRVIDATDVRGAAHARNVGVAHAQGDVLLFCDDDDLVSSTWVSEMSRAVAPLRAVSCPMLYFRSGHSPSLFAEVCDFESGLSDMALTGVEGFYYLGLPVFFGGNLAISRQDYMALGGMDESFRYGSEDRDLAFRFLASGGEIVTINSSFLAVRERGSLLGALQRAWLRGADNMYLVSRHAAGQDDGLPGQLSWKSSLRKIWALSNVRSSRRALVDCVEGLSELRGKVLIRLFKHVRQPTLFDYSSHHAEE